MLVHIGIDKIEKQITITNNRDSLPAVHRYCTRDYTWVQVKRVIKRLSDANWDVRLTT